jgi:hypothetical protein
VPIDASFIADARYALLPQEKLRHDYVLIGHHQDGSPARAFVHTKRASPLQHGFGAAFWDDGQLRHFGFYDQGACISSVDLHPPTMLGVFEQGAKMRTGEVYKSGTVETLSPWSDNDEARPTEQRYESWVTEHVAAVLRAGGR